MRCRTDARRAVHVEADVTVADERRLPGVNSHPDAQRQSVEAALSRGGGGNCIVGAREREEERVALHVDLVACGERLSQT